MCFLSKLSQLIRNYRNNYISRAHFLHDHELDFLSKMIQSNRSYRSNYIFLAQFSHDHQTSFLSRMNRPSRNCRKIRNWTYIYTPWNFMQNKFL